MRWGTICASSRFPTAARASRCRSSGCPTVDRPCARARGSAAGKKRMLAAAELKDFVRAARAMLVRERDLAAFEVYCASAEHRVARLAYTSDIPSRGVEELKSHVADGFSLRIVMRRDAREIGTATEAGDLSLEALRAAIGRARSAALVDPHFPGLPDTPRKLGAGRARAPSDGLLGTDDRALVLAAWRIVGGALREFAPHGATSGRTPGLVLGATSR